MIDLFSTASMFFEPTREEVSFAMLLGRSCCITNEMHELMGSATRLSRPHDVDRDEFGYGYGTEFLDFDELRKKGYA